MSFIEDLDISYLHVFSYSQRQDTRAASLSNQVTKENKDYRSKSLHILSNKKRTEFYNQSWDKTNMVSSLECAEKWFKNEEYNPGLHPAQ